MPFRSLFDRFSRPVLAFLLDMIGDRTSAEEAMQETFVRAFRKRDSWRGESAFSTWLFAIARNVAREQSRQRARRKETSLDDEVVATLSTAEPGPHVRAEEAEAYRAVRIALRMLPEAQRAVFVLKVLEQLSYDDISTITGSSVPKLKTDLHRARAEMRRRLRPWIAGLADRGGAS